MTRSVVLPAVIRAGWLRQVVVVAFLAGMLALCVRSLVTDDARFGWGMFGTNVAYTVHYEWQLADGSRVTYRPGNELAGIAMRLAQAPEAPWLPRTFAHGSGALRAWIRAYQAYLFDTRRPPDAVAIEARLRSSANPVPGRAAAHADVRIETLRYPAGAASAAIERNG